MQVGRGTSLDRIYVTWPHAVAIGEACRIERDTTFKVDGPYSAEIRIRIGRRVFVGSGVEFNITTQISIGDDALIASGCRFIDHDHGFSGSMPIRLQSGRWERLSWAGTAG